MKHSPSLPADAGGGGVPSGATLAGLEPVFSPQQVGQYLQLDPSTVRRLFIDRPGVLKVVGAEAGEGKRSYTTIRIPKSELQKFMREVSR